MRIPISANDFFRRHIVLILWTAALAYTLPVYDKYWAPFDEGIVTVAAQRVLAGEIPYKDFFIVMYPPGQVYILAAIFKIFSHSLIAGRIYAVFISVSSSILTFFMAHRLTKNMTASLFAWLMVLTSLAPRLGAIPAPIWPGVLLTLMSLYIFMLYLRNGRPLHIFLSGLVCGMAIAFRHDIGSFGLISILIALLTQSIRKRDFKNIIFFIAGALLVTLAWVSYFINMSAGKDLFNSLIAFAFVHQKTASLPFPKPCLDLNMIFHGSLHFISINQFYIPIIIYAFVSFILLSSFLKKSGSREDTNLSLLALLVFGVLVFNQVRIRPDPAHLLTVIEPAMILSAFIMQNTFSVKPSRPMLMVKYAAAIILMALLILLLVKNIDKYLKNTYTKAFKRNIIKTVFDKGAIYLPKEERDDVLSAIKFIKENTSPDDKIYIGNIAHWKDDFGGSLIIYYLADRMPSTKFYELLPGLVTDGRVQKEISDSLISKDVKLVMLQDIDTGTIKEEDASGDSVSLDRFLRQRYRLVKKFGKYNIYLREFQRR